MKRVSSLLAIALISALALGVATAKWISNDRSTKTNVEDLRAQQRFSAVAKEGAQKVRPLILGAEPAAIPAMAPEESHLLVNEPTTAKAFIGTNLTDYAKLRPQITTNGNGRKTYFFPELYGTNSQIIARDAQFRELLGYTKLAFRTSEGTRYYDLDDLHPEVIRSLGYDSTVLKRRLAEEFRHRQVLGAQAQFQADLRIKAASELAEREKAAAERAKAEAAIREAEARERIAAAAERAVTNPPRERIYQRYLIVPGGKTFTNAPSLPPPQPSFPSIQPVP